MSSLPTEELLPIEKLKELAGIKRLEGVNKRYGGADIVEAVHDFLVQENAAEQKKRIAEGRIGNFYPSSIGRCQRAVAYQMMGYPAKVSITQGQGLLIMQNGTSFHNRMEDIFDRMGIMVAPELSLKFPELRISGRSDAIIWNYLFKEGDEPGEEIVLQEKVKEKVEGEEEEIEVEKEIYRGPKNHILIVEFKSINSKGFKKLTKAKPLEKHEMQLQLYFYLTGIRKGMVWYENKDNQEIKIYHIEYDEALVQKTIEYIQTVIRYVDGKDLPEREGNPVDLMCRYCDFRNICHVPISDEEWLEIYFKEDDEAA